MNWLLVVAIAWAVLVLPLGYLIGTILRGADRLDRPVDPRVERLAEAPPDFPAGGVAETVTPGHPAPRPVRGAELAGRAGEQGTATDRVPAMPAEQSVTEPSPGPILRRGEG